MKQHVSKFKLQHQTRLKYHYWGWQWPVGCASQTVWIVELPRHWARLSWVAARSVESKMQLLQWTLSDAAPGCRRAICVYIVVNTTRQYLPITALFAERSVNNSISCWDTAIYDYMEFICNYFPIVRQTIWHSNVWIQVNQHTNSPAHPTADSEWKWSVGRWQTEIQHLKYQ